jgi:signal transduction histidine kinase/ligand-binding sensor domain-containing protein/AraC-like DNA-binding protein
MLLLNLHLFIRLKRDPSQTGFKRLSRTALRRIFFLIQILSTLSIQRILLLILIFAVQISHAQSDSYNFINFTNKDGLSSNAINAILKDRYGYMWFGTDDGLTKFDGETFKVYRHQPNDTTSIDGNRISAICEDGIGNLWVGTNESLFYYDRKKDAFTSYKSLGCEVVRVLCIDYLGNLWIGGYKGLFMLNTQTGKIRHYEAQPAMPDQLIANTIVSLFEDSRHRLWVGTNQGLHLYLRDKNCFRRFIHADEDPLSISDNVIRVITEDRNHNLWIGTNDGGISRLLPDGKGFKNFRSNSKDANTLSSDRVYAIVPDYAGKLWIGTEEGVNIFDPVSFNVIRVPNDPRNKYSLGDKSIRSIYIDKNDIYWIGTLQGGVGKYDMNLAFFNLRQSNPFDSYGLSAPKVTSFAEDDEGDIYVGTDGGGLNHYHRKTGLFCHPRLVADAARNKALKILAMERLGDELWISAYGKGLFVLNIKTKAVKHYVKGSGPKDLLSNDIFCLKKDSRGNLWIGTNGDGINVFKPLSGSFSRFEKNTAISADNFVLNGFIRAIEEDRSGNIWFGTNGTGITMYNPSANTFRTLDRENSDLPSDFVSTIYVNKQGTVWVGTLGGGLSKLNEKNKFISYSEKEGLSNAAIYKILETDSGILWLSHNKGISSFDERTKKFKNYFHQNGLQESTFFLGAGSKTSSGELFFGGLDGFNFFNPHTLKSNKALPPIVFTDLKISNQSVVPGPDEAIKEHISVAKKITLGYHQNFSLEFTVLNYTDPQNTRYSYKLEGFDKDWNHVGASHKAVYTNLDPGNYTFLLKATSDDGLLVSPQTSIKIYVKPPFWRTAYAFAFYIMLAGGILLALRYSGIRRIKRKFALEKEKLQVRQMIEQERREADKQHQFDQQKIKFLTNLSHEFRTPISLIVGPLEQVFEEEINDRTYKKLSLVRRNANRLLNLVNQLLDFRKMEANELMLHLNKGDFIPFVKEIADSFSDLSKSKGIKFNFISSENSLYMSFDKDKVERILLNLLSNAFKFTHENGEVNLKIERQFGSMVKISISDTGIGIPTEMQDKIFDRFFQADSQNDIAVQGSGIGLSIAKEFIRIHGGSIEVDSAPGKGSLFTILLPCSKDNGYFERVLPYTHSKSDGLINDCKNGNGMAERQKFSVLIVEDNEDFRNYLKENLENYYKIIEASNGREGWQKVLSEHPEIVVSDVSMPYMDGIALSQKIKSDKRTNHIPIILLTAIVDETNQLAGLKTGAIDYLTKPFSFEILKAKVNNLLGLSQTFKTTYTRHIKVETQAEEIQSEDDKLMLKITKYIEDNIDSPQLNVEDLSKHVFMTRQSLYNKMVSLTGETPVEFIRTFRLNKAARLLEQSDLKIAQIGYAVGFASPTYFTTSFKEKFNMSPSDYQKIKKSLNHKSSPSVGRGKNKK